MGDCRIRFLISDRVLKLAGYVSDDDDTNNKDSKVSATASSASASVQRHRSKFYICNTIFTADTTIREIVEYKVRVQLVKDTTTINTSTTIEISAPEGCPIEAEGEWMGWLPAKIEMLPKHINFLR